ncbi:hypothetical protein CR513_12515, partial [Mucuna pruriens]
MPIPDRMLTPDWMPIPSQMSTIVRPTPVQSTPIPSEFVPASKDQIHSSNSSTWIDHPRLGAGRNQSQQPYRMRSPRNIKEVQQVASRITALAHFLSWSYGQKSARLFFRS